MNPQSPNPIANGAATHVAGAEAETTLRLIAALPAPEGLEDRIHAALNSTADQKRKPGRLLAWRSTAGTGDGRSSGPSHAPASVWMRSAAAAAIAFVVAGGAWGVYSRVQPGRLISTPAQVETHGSFAGAGAIRTPQTLNGPVLTHPLKAHAAPQKPAKKAVAKNAAVHKAPLQTAATDAH